MTAQKRAVRIHRRGDRDVLCDVEGVWPAGAKDDVPFRVPAPMHRIAGGEPAVHRPSRADALRENGQPRGKIVSRVGQP